MLAPYRRLAAVPHLGSLVAWGLAGRLHMACTGISVTFLGADLTGSYAKAGLLVAALILGWGVGGPVRGRAADRGRPALQLAVTSGIYTAGIGALALLPARWWVGGVVLGFVTGLVLPATGQLARATFPRMASGLELRAAYTVDATAQDVLFLVGPLGSAFLVAVAGPRAAVGACAVLALVGSLGFAHALHRAGSSAAPPAQPAGRGPRLFSRPGLLAVLVVSMLVVASFSAMDIAIIAWSRDRGTPELAGIMIAVLAVGSVLGGLVVGGLAGRRPPRLWLRVGAIAVGFGALSLTLPPIAPVGVPLIVAAVLFVGGTALAPAAAASNEQFGSLAPGHRRAEAFGWMGTARTSGSAAAAPLAGMLLDTSGPAAATAAASVVALVAAGLAAVAARTPPAPADERPVTVGADGEVIDVPGEGRAA